MINSAGGAGALASSTSSYLKFFKTLIGGGLFSSSLQQQAFDHRSCVEMHSRMECRGAQDALERGES